MDGENQGKPYEQMDDLGGNTPIFGGPPILFYKGKKKHISSPPQYLRLLWVMIPISMLWARLGEFRLWDARIAFPHLPVTY